MDPPPRDPSTGAKGVDSSRFTAGNLDPDEVLSSNLFPQSGNTVAFNSVFDQPKHAWEVNLVPDLALRTTDSQHVEIFASIFSSSEPVRQRVRSVNRSARAGGPTSIMLMDRD